ncbi:MAG: hypothetical protein JRJ59_04640 [Deltaproteobacteria bacterium]|nr:hypothetical protein [Deltaproteobacteria bacterium]
MPVGYESILGFPLFEGVLDDDDILYLIRDPEGTAADYTISWATVLANMQSSPAWQNLLTALDGKADEDHDHAIGDVTGLQAALDGKSDTTHTHSDLHSHANKTTLDAIPDHSGASTDEVLTKLSGGGLGWEVVAAGGGDTVAWLTSAVTLVSGGTSTSWATITCTTLPSGAKLAMLSVDTGGGDYVYQYCSLRETDSGDAGYKTGATMAAKNYHVGDFNMVGLNGSKQFDYKVDWDATPVTIKLLGYVS